MPLIPLKVVLLFAVATSQIFGGISCCCLGRTFFADVLKVNNVAASKLLLQNEFPAVPHKRQTGRCPKCSVRKSSPATAVQSYWNDHRANVCESGKCRCVKIAVRSSTPSDPPSLNHDTHAGVGQVLDVKLEREALIRASAKYELPVRFGGRSWQSIACVWKN